MIQRGKRGRCEPEDPVMVCLREIAARLARMNSRLTKIETSQEKLVGITEDLKAQVASLKALGQSNKTALSDLEREVGETKDAVTALRDQIGQGTISATDAAELKTGLDEAIADMTDFQTRLGAAASGLDATQNPTTP